MKYNFFIILTMFLNYFISNYTKEEGYLGMSENLGVSPIIVF